MIDKLRRDFPTDDWPLIPPSLEINRLSRDRSNPGLDQRYHQIGYLTIRTLLSVRASFRQPFDPNFAKLQSSVGLKSNQFQNRDSIMLIHCSNRIGVALLASGLLFASFNSVAEEKRRIEDNSFLIEEAYNQEEGVVQYIQTYQYSKKTNEWMYTFTNEMPMPNQNHQFSYTVPIARVSGDSTFQTGIGDVGINYRYQLVTNDDWALAPRFTVILPTGKYREGLGNGATGYQVNIPLSVDLAENWISHWNAGATYTPNAREASGIQADIRGTNVGASVVYLFSETLNFLVEYVKNDNQAIQSDGSLVWKKSEFFNPGFRYAKNYSSGWQMVAGVSFPIGVGPSKNDGGVLLYLSFEK